MSRQKLKSQRRTFLNLLRRRKTKLQSIARKYWTIYGTGSIGDKAQELKDTNWAALQAGFVPYESAVLAMGFVEKFKKRNNLTGQTFPDGEQSIMNECEFSEQEKEILLEILRKFKGVPLAVRSSAHGDSRGTGIYWSRFCHNNSGNELYSLLELEDAIRAVIFSEMRTYAVKFRDKKDLPDGIAILIQPVFGKRKTIYELGSEEPLDAFFPDLSACGYTSLTSGPGYLRVAAGLPTAVVGREGTLKIHLTDENVALPLAQIENAQCPTTKVPVFTLMDFIAFGEDPDFMSSMQIVLESHFVGDLTLGEIAGKLRRLDQLLGSSYYVEATMRLNQGIQEWAILQIAKRIPSKHYIEFPEDPQNVLVDVTDVLGEGRASCNRVFSSGNALSVAELNGFNRQNQGYLLVILSDFFSEISGVNIEYGDICNAAAVIPVPGGFVRHGDSLKEHFVGLLEHTGILLLAANQVKYFAESFRKIGLFGERGLIEGVFDLDVEVLVSEKQKRGLAYLPNLREKNPK